MKNELVLTLLGTIFAVIVMAFAFATGGPRGLYSFAAGVVVFAVIVFGQKRRSNGAEAFADGALFMTALLVSAWSLLYTTANYSRMKEEDVMIQMLISGAGSFIAIVWTLPLFRRIGRFFS